MRNVSARVDVVMAESAPAPVPVEVPREPEGVDVAPDPHRRIIMLAPTKQQGQDEALALGIEPVAIVTPRSLHAARGMTADALLESTELTAEQRDELMPHALPSIATAGAGE